MCKSDISFIGIVENPKRVVYDLNPDKISHNDINTYVSYNSTNTDITLSFRYVTVEDASVGMRLTASYNRRYGLLLLQRNIFIASGVTDIRNAKKITDVLPQYVVIYPRIADGKYDKISILYNTSDCDN